MAQPKTRARITRSISKAIDDDMPTNDCPMDIILGESEEPCFDEETGEWNMEWVADDMEWNEDDYNRGITWGEWFSRHRNFIDPHKEREWHLWCWKNQHNDRCPEAAEYVERWENSHAGTSTRIQQRSHKTIATEEQREEERRIRANENPPPTAEAKR